MANFEFDLLIVGAGPAGCTLALNMAGKGIRIGIIEKDPSPRHKICGDALSGKVLNVMKRIPGNVYEDFLQQVEKIPSRGIRFVAPNHNEIDVPFLLHPDADSPPPGYVCKRNDFDRFLFEKLMNYQNIHVFEGERVDRVFHHADHVVAVTQNHEFRGKVIAGADGVNSTVRKFLQPGREPKEHFCVGIRGYFENVAGLHPENYIELAFLKSLLPGYFWIFPSTGGLVNAGFGMMQNRVSKERINLTQKLDELINTDPFLAPRFKHARLAGKPEAHRLPLGTHYLKRSGDRFILLGDAAFLVDPFSGEGIGNAMASGEISASILEQNFSNNDFSAEALLTYDARINKRFKQEFKTMSVMQRLAGSAKLFNMVVNKARKNNDVRELLSSMFTSQDVMKKLTSPDFYLKLLFK